MYKTKFGCLVEMMLKRSESDKAGMNEDHKLPGKNVTMKPHTATHTTDSSSTYATAQPLPTATAA